MLLILCVLLTASDMHLSMQVGKQLSGYFGIWELGSWWATGIKQVSHLRYVVLIRNTGLADDNVCFCGFNSLCNIWHPYYQIIWQFSYRIVVARVWTNPEFWMNRTHRESWWLEIGPNWNVDQFQILIRV